MTIEVSGEADGIIQQSNYTYPYNQHAQLQVRQKQQQKKDITNDKCAIKREL